jgi:hypothetical protein
MTLNYKNTDPRRSGRFFLAFSGILPHFAMSRSERLAKARQNRAHPAQTHLRWASVSNNAG